MDIFNITVYDNGQVTNYTVGNSSCKSGYGCNWTEPNADPFVLVDQFRNHWANKSYYNILVDANDIARKLVQTNSFTKSYTDLADAALAIALGMYAFDKAYSGFLNFGATPADQ